jgi:hypothetical protein
MSEIELSAPVNKGATYFDELKLTGISEKIKSHLQPKGWRLDPHLKKWTAPVSIDHDRPWIYNYIDMKRYCGLHQMVFDLYRFVPTFCLEHCWKICVTPEKVTELFEMQAIQAEIFAPRKINCKCGMDLREHTPHRYGGYWYCTTPEEWKERYFEVRKIIDERIGEHVPIVAKRYCTEMEMVCGPTDTYQQPKGAEFIESKFRELVDYKCMKYARQPQVVIENTKLRWLKYAYMIGDMSCLEFNDGKYFYPSLVTYHESFEKEEA